MLDVSEDGADAVTEKFLRFTLAPVPRASVAPPSVGDCVGLGVGDAVVQLATSLLEHVVGHSGTQHLSLPSTLVNSTP